jgi:hypothetical protein
VKFKTIFIIFNIVLILSFSIIFLAPVIMLGREYAGYFAAKSWIVAVFFLATLGVINFYFLSRWKLFGLLEKENWEELALFLENRIYRRRRVRRGEVKILINAYLIGSELDRLMRLEAYLAQRKPVLAGKFALHFGLPDLLKNDPAAVEAYFRRFADDDAVPERGWMRWNVAFALLLQQRVLEARDLLLTLSQEAAEPLLRLLTVYLLDSCAGEDGKSAQAVRESRQRLTRRFGDLETWNRKVVARSGNVEALILSQVVRDASSWLYARGVGEPA